MKESPGSLSAYLVLVGIITILLEIIQFFKIPITINPIYQLFFYASLIMGGFLIYFGLTLKRYLQKSPETLMIFISLFILFYITLGVLSGLLFKLVFGLAIGIYLIVNIDRLSKEMKAKKIKIKEVKADIVSVEKIYYEDKDVNITNLYAIIMDEIYPMTDISSVAMKTKPPNFSVAIISAVIGVSLLICGGITVGSPDSKDYKDILIGVIIVGIILVVVGFVVGFPLKKTYVVKICCASTESDAIVSKDKEYIQGIVDSIKQAITDRGI